VVTKTVIDQPVQVYAAEVGTPLPADLEKLRLEGSEMVSDVEGSEGVAAQLFTGV
jgi:hypothetical protein